MPPNSTFSDAANQLDSEHIIARDMPIAISKLNDIKETVDHVNQILRNIIDRVKNGELNMEHGISFLDVKNHLFLKYLTNLVYVILRKVSGESIEGDESIDRIVEIRTFLERMRPVEQKLKYQIEKLLKMASTGKLPDDDPRRFKANMQNMASKANDDGDEEGEDEDEDEVKPKKDQKPGIYVPPKLVPMEYNEDDGFDRAKKAADRAKRLALSASALQQLKEDYMDAPAEIVESSAVGVKMNLARERKEIQEYEETYFTRLPVTRKDRHNSRFQHSESALGDELAGFMGNSGAKKKRKIPVNKTKSFKGFKRKHRR
nr:EOG090X0IJO [Macrothrix elegans]